MRHALLVAGVAALGFSGAVLAKPGMGHGAGMPHGNPHAESATGPHGLGFGAHPAGPAGFGAGGCPPGLAKKAAACVPPGLAKHEFVVGERIPTSFGALVPFNALPRTVRTRIGHRVDRHSGFVSTDRLLVSVNPRTRVVERVTRLR